MQSDFSMSEFLKSSCDSHKQMVATTLMLTVCMVSLCRALFTFIFCS